MLKRTFYEHVLNLLKYVFVYIFKTLHMLILCHLILMKIEENFIPTPLLIRKKKG